MQYNIKGLFDIFLSESSDIEIRSTTVESDELHPFIVMNPFGETVIRYFYPLIPTIALSRTPRFFRGH